MAGVRAGLERRWRGPSDSVRILADDDLRDTADTNPGPARHKKSGAVEAPLGRQSLRLVYLFHLAN